MPHSPYFTYATPNPCDLTVLAFLTPTSHTHIPSVPGGGISVGTHRVVLRLRSGITVGLKYCNSILTHWIVTAKEKKFELMLQTFRRFLNTFYLNFVLPYYVYIFICAFSNCLWNILCKQSYTLPHCTRIYIPH